MREAELWRRMSAALGEDYVSVWAQSVVLGELEGRTVVAALAAGVECKLIWRAVWRQLELPQQQY